MVAGHGDEELMKALMRSGWDFRYFEGEDILGSWWKERRKEKKKEKEEEFIKREDISLTRKTKILKTRVPGLKSHTRKTLWKIPKSS